MLEQLQHINTDIVGVCTKETSKFNEDHVDLKSFCELNLIPWIYTDDINSIDTSIWIRALSPDVIFCFGWSQIIKREILEIAPLGVIGFHPTALPKNRGRHPLIWSLVLGLEETASTFFRMNSGADSGDIVSQVKVEISIDDDASSLYDKVSRVAISQLNELVPRLRTGKIQIQKQNESVANTWRKRGYSDGLIDWRMSATTIHNLVRGLSAPYPGAHFLYEGREIKVWKTAIYSPSSANIEPGKVLATTEIGPIVKCGIDAVCLVETDPEFMPAEGDYL
jgi:methionyl-tRNA formyltransferase